MDDRFLNDLRREPRPGYARALRERLREVEASEPRARFRLHPAFAGAIAAALVAVAFTFPAVRVAAQSALDLFRVRQFAPVEVDLTRLEKLKALHRDAGPEATDLIFPKKEVLLDPGKPTEVATLADAAEKVGWSVVRTPSDLPRGFKSDKIVVNGAGAMRFTIASGALRKVVETLGLTDVQVPEGLDGQQITARMPGSVIQQFSNGRRSLMVVQGGSPELTMPPGVDFAKLGELGLRVLGLDAAEAHRMASTIDWRSTLLVPVPLNAAEFRQVTVNGHPGLLIETTAVTKPDGTHERPNVIVMWTEGEGVAAVTGDIDTGTTLEVAQSLH